MKKILWLICSAWEVIYKNMIGARFLEGSEQRLVRVAYRKFGKREKTLNGLTLKKGDLIAQMHLSNLTLSRYNGVKSPEWAMYRDMISEFKLLSKQIKEENKPVKALTAITVLSPPAVRLGFIVEEIPPGLWATINYFWLRLLRIAFSPKEMSELKALDIERKAVEVWMPVAEFVEKF